MVIAKLCLDRAWRAHVELACLTVSYCVELTSCSKTIVALDQYLYLHSTVPLTVQTQCSVCKTYLCHISDYVDMLYRNICQCGEYGIYLILFLRQKITMWLCRRCSEDMGPKSSVPCGVLEWSGYVYLHVGIWSKGLYCYMVIYTYILYIQVVAYI